MTQTTTAKLIANLPLEPRSLISPSDDDDVTFVTTESAPGLLCGTSDKHLATPAVFLPSVSLIDHLCKCLKVEPLTSRHLAPFSSRLPPTPSLTGGKTVKFQTQTFGVRKINVRGRKTSRYFHWMKGKKWISEKKRCVWVLYWLHPLTSSHSNRDSASACPQSWTTRLGPAA